MGARKTGVYCFLNRINGKRYVGSAAYSLSSRKATHITRLNSGTHANSHFQAAWAKYGKEVFEYSVIEECPSIDCITKEQYWIDFHKAADPRYGYNLRLVAQSNKGLKIHSEKIIEANRKKARDPQRLAKIAAASKGHVVTEETRAKIRVGHLGKKQSYAHTRLNKLTHMGKTRSTAGAIRRTLGRKKNATP